jgi:hypothetical protein
MSLEIQTAPPGAADAFWQRYDRDWRSELWKFRVVWHEQTHDVVAREGDRIEGALRLRIAASLAHVEALHVVPELPQGQRGSLSRRRRAALLRRGRLRRRSGDPAAYVQARRRFAAQVSALI